MTLKNFNLFVTVFIIAITIVICSGEEGKKNTPGELVYNHKLLERDNARMDANCRVNQNGGYGCGVSYTIRF